MTARCLTLFDVDTHALIERGLQFAPRLLAGLFVGLASYAVWRFARRGFAVAARKTGTDRTTIVFLETAVKYAIFIFGVVTALAQVGVDTVSIVASLGVAGLTLGFAAKDVLSNLIAGLFIFWDRPFVLGDLVEIGGNYGRVHLITLRSTRIVTPDGRMLAVPNTVIVNGTITSYTDFPNLRLDIPITVGVGEDLGRIRKTLLELCPPDQGFLVDPPPAMVVTAVNDYNVQVELQAWIGDEKEHLTKRFALRERMFESLRSAGIDMPFETLRIAPLELKAESLHRDAP